MTLNSRILVTLLVAAATGAGAHSAWATPVATIDTGVADWKYVSTTSADPSPTNVSASLLTPNPDWLSASFIDASAGESTPSAQWIGSNPNGGTTGYYGNSVFSLTIAYADFHPPVAAGPQHFEISGVLSADNEVIDLYFYNSNGLIPLSLTYDGAVGKSQAYGFNREFTANSSGLLHDPIVLFAVVHNDLPIALGGESGDNPNNPMGLIVAGSIRAVPLPSSVGLGFAMLAGFGALAVVRKSLRRKATIA